MSRLIALLFLWSLAGVLSAQTLVKDPVRDYLGQPNAPQNPFITTKGIQELTIDVSGNGKNVIFISAAGYSDGKEGNIWTAYVPNNGQYTRIEKTTNDTNIVFSTIAFYNGPITELDVSGFIAYIRGSKDAGELWLYKFSGDQLSVQTVKALNLNKDADYALAQKYFGFGNSTLRSEAEHPATIMTPEELRDAGYSLLQENDVVPPRRPDRMLPPSTKQLDAPQPSSTASPTESSSLSPLNPKPTPTPAPLTSSGTSIPNWIYIVVVLSLGLIGCLWYFMRAKK